MKNKQCYEEHIACHGDTCNKEIAHTPTPWKVSLPLGEGDIQIQSEKVNAYGNFINAVIPFREFTEEDKANAAFIVRAVNSHEALIEANEWLSSVLDMCEEIEGVHLTNQETGRTFYDDIRKAKFKNERALKAIAQAEGK